MRQQKHGAGNWIHSKIRLRIRRNCTLTVSTQKEFAECKNNRGKKRKAPRQKPSGAPRKTRRWFSIGHTKALHKARWETGENIELGDREGQNLQKDTADCTGDDSLFSEAPDESNFSWLTDWRRNTSFMAFNSIPSWNSEMKEVMKVCRQSAVQNTLLPFAQWQKKLQDTWGEKKKNWARKRNYQQIFGRR